MNSGPPFRIFLQVRLGAQYSAAVEAALVSEMHVPSALDFPILSISKPVTFTQEETPDGLELEKVVSLQ